MQNTKYKRILLKLSGEALMGDSQNVFDKSTIDAILLQIKQLNELDIKVGLVIGAGNLFRGINADKFGLTRANADYIGILATVMNGIALKDFLSNIEVPAKIYSALAISNIVKEYNRDSMLKRLNDGDVIIFVAGTGLPYFTTDTTAVLRAIDMGAELIIKATKVDGVYDSDPKINSLAKKYNKLTFDEAIHKNLKIMDMAEPMECLCHHLN
ncbi:MAG TPA: UMP kinase [Burkholderiales bacterium]|nr:UMP kinase [Burkholderiales bacterium]